jgi:lipoprotein-anchoring transpeptidase ErfK/SrfK
MWFYGIDDENHKKYLLKTYKVGLGRKDSKKPSSCLTPIGKYQLGGKVAIYRPGTMGYFQDRQIEMIRVFGTRWMPFEKEIANCSDNAKGYGIHGAPWRNDDTGLVEEREKIGKYDSDGCIRLFSEDIEEIFAIVISKPTIVELVNDFKDANYLESKSIGN